MVVQTWSWAELRRTRAVYEDEDVLVLDKPPGLAVVAEGASVDLAGLARAAGEWVMPAHRIDKVTSGALVLARTPAAHADLARQFNRRTVEKAYLAIARPGGLPEAGTIDLPLSAGRKGRVRVAAPRERIRTDGRSWTVDPADVLTAVRTYPSVTTFERLWEDDRNSVLVARPLTGRRHQIRVHLAWIGHAVEGDPLFDAGEAARTCLHSWRIAFDAPRAGGGRMTVEAPPDEDFWRPVRDRMPEQPSRSG